MIAGGNLRKTQRGLSAWPAAALIAMVGVLSCAAAASGDTTASSPTMNRYLAHIFNKYGSRGKIGFEGLEHLMHSLRLGGVEFQHTVAEHRSKDFRLPEIVLNVTHEHETTDEPEAQAEPVVAVPVVVPKRDESANRTTSGGSDGVVFDGAGDGTDDMWRHTAIHDPKHRHPRHNDKGFEACLSPIALLHMAIKHKRNTDRRTAMQQHQQQQQQNRFRRHSHGDENKHDHDNVDYDDTDDDNEPYAVIDDSAQITPDMFLDMCPLMLLQIDQRACADDVRMERVPEPPSYEQNKAMSWLYASVSILAISMCGLLGVAIVPLTKSDGYQHVLGFLVALAVGTLCGDALMHLLPHALTSHQHGDPVQPAPTLFTNGDRAFEPVWLLFCTFMTALGMYALETALPLLGHQSSTGHGHGHSHGHGHGHQHAPIEMKPIEEESGGMVGRMLAEPQTKKRRQRQSLSPVALMVLLGDGLHNVTDGMAIGAAFAVDPVTGFATALAVLCHELPHELGDFALLLQTGVSVRRALAFNVLSSVLSVLGMCAGLAVGGASATMVRWIYAGTAGTFLYIALADLVPEMRSGGGGGGGDAGRQRSAAWLVAVQVVGVLAGGLLMLAIALYEERLKTLFD